MASETGPAPAELAAPPADGAPPVEAQAVPRLPAELEAALRDAPWSFDFFQAVRRIECASPTSARIGTSSRATDDPVRFGQTASLAFAPATVAGYTPGRNQRPPRLACAAFGLFGPNGPLPIHLTEYALERERFRRDPTLARFLDLFHHRMLSLFYRAWAMARPTVSFDRPHQDWFARYLGSLFGIGMAGLRNRDAMPDRAKLYYAGLLAGHSHHPDGLVAILGDFFGLAVRLKEFVAEWIRIPEAARSRLGGFGDNAALGRTAILGVCSLSAQHRFRLLFGPLTLADFLRFLPGTPGLVRVAAIVRNYCGDELAWDVNLILKREDVPALRLDGGARLGWTTWLPASRFDRDPDEVVLTPLAGVA